MRRDICYFYPTNIEAVYSAFRIAVKQQFKKDAEGTPYHTLTFGLNFSLKYNMNGGGCNVHFMPYEGGTAVDIHYTIAQAIGARYEAHAKDLTACAEKILGAASQRIDIDPESFTSIKVEPSPSQPIQQPAPQPQPVQQPAPQPQPQPVQQPAPQPQYQQSAYANFPSDGRANFCPRCGKAFAHDANFCANCGAKRP